MSRAVSIHIGVNRPRAYPANEPLRDSEINASRMAEVARRGGYDSQLVLRGPTATYQAVHDALSEAARILEAGDILFLSFSGHGIQQPDDNLDERCAPDEAWCLHDGILLDDELPGFWTRFDPGVRILVVVECCYSGGFGDAGALHSGAAGKPDDFGQITSNPISLHTSEPGWEAAVADAVRSCIASPPYSRFGIRASVLMLTASREQQTAQDGLFSRFLLAEWAGGDFRGSYCDLYERVRQRVMGELVSQEPQILMLGAPDPDFPLMPAFRRVYPDEQQRHRMER
jgi:hypothetical protein